jgi:predicted nucleotidyltransferase
MDAAPLLALAARLIAKHRLDAVLIGNAAAALHGAPVTTIDLDFMIRDTPANQRKLKRIAKELDAVIYRPFYPASDLYRIMRESTGLQFDFMPRVSGVASLESLRSRATTIQFGEHALRVAALEDIIRSKEAAGRPRDLAVLPDIRRVVRERAPAYGAPKRRRKRT